MNSLLRVEVHSSYYQNLEAVIQSFSQGNAIIQHQWKSHAFSCIKPGIDYFNDKFGSDTAYPLNDVSSTIDISEWWKRNEAALPNWSAAAKKILLLQPSSAASERVSSLLTIHLDLNRTVALRTM